MGLLGLLGFLLNEMDFAGFFGFDDIVGFEKIVILRFLIFWVCVLRSEFEFLFKTHFDLNLCSF